MVVDRRSFLAALSAAGVLTQGWRRHFRVVGPKSVMAGISIGIVLIAIAADHLHFLNA